jgi:hypothetical protein
MSSEKKSGVESPPRVGVFHLAKYGLLTVLVAVGANALVLVIARSVIAVPAGFWPLGWGAVIISTVITAVGATIVYGGITRLSQRPNRLFTIVATVVLVLSFGSFIAPAPPLVGAPAAVRPPLAVMHMIVAVVSVGILTQMTDTETIEESP